MSLLIQKFEARQPEGVIAVQYTKQNGQELVEWIGSYGNEYISQKANIVGGVLHLRTELNSEMFDFGLLEGSDFPPTFDYVKYDDMIIFMSSTHYSWFVHSTLDGFLKKYLLSSAKPYARVHNGELSYIHKAGSRNS